MRNVERDTKISLSKGNSDDPKATSLRFSDEIPKKEIEKYKIPSLPTKAHKVNGLRYFIPLNKSKIIDLYDSNSTCAVLLSYHHSLNVSGFTQLSLPLPLPFSMEKITDEELYNSVVGAVKHPVCIQTAATKFINDMFDNSAFVAIHWRYDMKEWGNVFSKRSYSKVMYRNLMLMTAEDVANGVKMSLGKIKIKPEKLFIATIPSAANFAKIVAKLLGFDTTVLSSEEFVKNKYQGCLESNNWNIGEVVSMLDMELCERSDVFYYSNYSTWSSNVRPRRVLNVASGIKRAEVKDEFSIYDVSLRSMQQRVELL